MEMNFINSKSKKILKEKIIRISFFCFIILISFVLTSCKSNKEEDTKTGTDKIKINDKVNILWDGSKNYNFEQRDRFMKDIEAAKEKLNNKIYELERIAGYTIGNASIKYDKSVKDLKEEREYLNKKMSGFNNVTQNSWNDFKSGINSIWDKIENTWESTSTN